MMFANWVDEHREEIVEKTQGLLRINSVGGPATGPEEPFGPGCREALDYFLNLGRELGFSVKNVDGYAGHVEFGEGEEYIAVLGHLDVVPVGTGWTYPPFGAEIHDGKIYARGAIDDKGPTMAALYALKAVKESGLPLKRKVRLIVGLDEETNWRCVDHYFAKEPKPIGGFTPDADFPLIYAEKGILCFKVTQKRASFGEAPLVVKEMVGGNRVNMVPDFCRVTLQTHGDANRLAQELAAKAEQMNIRVEMEAKGSEVLLFVHGVSVHSMAPQHGVNAVVEAARLLAQLELPDRALWQFVAEVDTAGERLGIQMVCRETGPLTCNLGVAEVDGEHVNFRFNVRFPVDKTFEELMGMMAQKLAPLGLAVEESDDINMKPHYVPKESEIVQTLLRVYEEEVGEKAEPLITGGGTYARAIPNAVAFGALFPGQEETAHQRDEHWAVEDLLRCTKIYAKAIYELAK
jgi:succinyl-diaminopimelate desuccinylase